MTNKEKIENQYRLLGLAINWRGPDKHNQLKCVRRHCDAIKELLKPEPETLAGSVIRLTDICNKLEKENAVITRSNAWLRKQLTRKDESLRACRASEGTLKERNDQLKRALFMAEGNLTIAERRVASLRATCSKVMADAGVKELRASNVMLLRQNQKLEEDLKIADILTKELQVDIAKLNAIQDTDRHAFHRMAEAIEKLEDKLASREACLRRVGDNLERIKAWL